MSENPDSPVAFLAVHPVLAVDELEPALAWYRDRLGFEVAWRWGGPPVRAGVRRDALELHLHREPDAGARWTSQVYFHVTGVEAYHRRCVEGGATITSELALRPWGLRDFRVVDPWGNRLGFGEVVQGA